MKNWIVKVNKCNIDRREFMAIHKTHTMLLSLRRAKMVQMYYGVRLDDNSDKSQYSFYEIRYRTYEKSKRVH